MSKEIYFFAAELAPHHLLLSSNSPRFKNYISQPIAVVRSHYTIFSAFFLGSFSLL